MQEPIFIRKVAVLGAGVMGAQIAAQCVNAGIETLLFDLAAKEGDLNGIVNKALVNLTKLKPSPLATPETATLIQARNYEQNLADLSSCDLIIEAIAERLDWKEALYQKITPYLREDSIIVSNTSGLSIDSLGSVLPEKHRNHFCGVHFFNPPRYMHLAELIPAKQTSAALLDTLETWLTSALGKGVVRAKDTPNFIANRIGVFSLLATLHHTMAMDMGLDEVDALTGVLLGRPKSATYRTMDVVGLDTMEHVVNTMKEQLKDDPWHGIFVLPDWLMNLIKNGALGQKSGQGIYKKTGSVIEVYDIKTGTYRPAKGEVSEELQKIMHMSDPVLRMQALMSSSNKQAKFLSACFRDLFHYCAYFVETIAHTVRDVDLAIRWGFGWMQGPFETWQVSGIKAVVDDIDVAIKEKIALADASLPKWLLNANAFYSEKGAYCPQKNAFESRSNLPVYQHQFFPDRVLMEPKFTTKVLYENEGVRLAHLQDEIAILSFKSKANTIGQEVIDGINAAMDVAEKQCMGVILYQFDANNFSSGANLKSILGLIQENKLAAVEEMVQRFQNTAMRIKYSPIPVIAALRGRALGGGCELMMQCDGVVAAFESYPGLVELGVGVIPGGGGCKEMAQRAAMYSRHSDVMAYLQIYFQQIGMAQVASSARDAMRMGYLRRNDTIVMHVDEVLYAAVAKIKAMKAANYKPALKRSFKVAGIEGHARLQAAMVNMLEGGFMTQHDYTICNELAWVLCGGDLYQGTLVDEAWMLKLEREAFMRLCANPLTVARIKSILETGKPLRN